MQAIYKGITFEVIRSNGEETLLTANGYDRQFARTSECQFLEDLIAIASTSKEPETKTTESKPSKTKALVSEAEKTTVN